MPKILKWNLVKEFDTENNLTEYLDLEHKFTSTIKSNKYKCSICEFNHKMRIIYKLCNSNSCNSDGNKNACQFQLKILKCEKLPKFLVYSLNKHIIDPEIKVFLDSRQSSYGVSKKFKDLILEFYLGLGITSAKRIYVHLKKYHNCTDLPSLLQLRNFLKYIRSKNIQSKYSLVNLNDVTIDEKIDHKDEVDLEDYLLPDVNELNCNVEENGFKENFNEFKQEITLTNNFCNDDKSSLHFKKLNSKRIDNVIENIKKQKIKKTLFS